MLEDGRWQVLQGWLADLGIGIHHRVLTLWKIWEAMLASSRKATLVSNRRATLVSSIRKTGRTLVVKSNDRSFISVK